MLQFATAQKSGWQMPQMFPKKESGYEPLCERPD
jgi:hypothetical protein